MKNCFYQKNGHTYLRVRLTPKANKNGVGDVYTDASNLNWLKCSVTTVPEKGKANQTLIKLLSKQLNIPKTAFTITAGLTDRSKTLRIDHTLDL